MMKKRKITYRLCLVILVATLLVITVISPGIDCAPGNGEVCISYDVGECCHLMTEEEVQLLRESIGTYDPERNYNIIIDGHGTGLAPPTERDYESMISTMKIVNNVDRDPSIRAAHDLTDDPWFPPADTQGGQGSCASWAAAYYCHGYMQAKAYDWDASTGNDEYLMSPSWVYNKINGGSDSGSNLVNSMYLATSVGNANLATMPYDDDDHISWGGEAAWRNAVKHRATDVESTSVNNINVVKSWVDQGTPISMALDAYEYNFGDGNILHTGNYDPGSPNHANTVVGYDDDVGVPGEMGAFKLINSWGETWGPNGDGTYYMTYDCFQTLAWSSVSRMTGVIYDGDTSQPSLVAVTELSTTGARDAAVELGIGDPGAPVDTRAPQWNGGSYSYPNFMAFDITEFESSWSGGAGSEDSFYLYIGSASSSSTISSFKIEYYYGYDEGNPTAVSNESPDTPASTPATVTVDFILSDPPEVTVLSPNGGEEWYAYSDEEISWIATPGENPIDYIDLWYSDDAGTSWKTIASGLPDTGSYAWTVANANSDQCLVRVRAYDTVGRGGEDQSDAAFTIVGEPPAPPQNLMVEYYGESIHVLFQDDVEGGDMGYVTDTSHYDASEWGIRGHGASSGNYSWDFGDGMFNKRSDVGMLSWLISPEISIPTNADEEYGVSFTFEHWRDWGDNGLYDAGNVKISTDGDDGPWTLIVPEEGYDGTVPTDWDNPLGGQEAWGGTSDWTTTAFDLTDYIGETIHIRWDSGTEAWDGLEGPGWRVDDINMEALIIDDEGTDHNLLTWEASSDDPDEVGHYSIFRSEFESGPWDGSTFIGNASADGSVNYTYIDENKGTADEILWWYVVRAVGTNGLEEQNTNAVPEPDDLIYIDIPLTAGGNADGWNFVSFNLIPTDTSLEAILADIDGSYDKLMFYDASTGEWRSYAPGRTDRYNNLDTWNHQMGIWIHMTTTDTLNVEGSAPTSTDITLYPGWTMVGLPSETSGNHGLPGEVDVIGYFDASQANNLAYDHSPGIFAFEPGKGYWLYNPTDSAVVWTVNY